MAESVSIPKGFVLDSSTESSTSIPEGFILDVSRDIAPPESDSFSDNTIETPSKSIKDIPTDIAGDVTRGALNSIAGAADKINGTVKLLNNLTNIDIGSQNLSNVSDSLKQLANKQPGSDNAILSGISQFVGAAPEAILEFAGSGGPAGFVARSAALSAADAYNKTQSPTDLVKGAAVGATVGVTLNAVPGLIEGSAKIAKKWGETAGKTYFQRVTGATNDEAEQFIKDINKMDLNTRNEVEDYNDSKLKASEDVSNIRQSNNDIVNQQKEQNHDVYLTTKEDSIKAMQDFSRNNDSIIEDLKDSQIQDKINIARANADNIIAASDSATQRLSDATTQQVASVANAKNALSNELTSIFSNATKQLEAMQKGVEENVAMAHAALEKNGLDYVQTPIIQSELDNAIARNGKGFFKTITSGDGRSLLVTAKEGVRTPAVENTLNLVNSVRANLVNDFLKNGRTSLSAIQANQALLEGAISRGFKGEALPKDLAEMLSQVKQSINPTKLYNKFPDELSHLQPLADSNKAYSSQIDGLRGTLDLYKDNVDGTINPDKVFKALDRNDTGYIAKLRMADETLPKKDRIFGKVKNAYDNFKYIENSEKINLSRIEKTVSDQRKALKAKFDDMESKLVIEQRKQMSQVRTGNSYAERDLANKQRKAIADLQYKQKQMISNIKIKKDQELATLQKSLNDRLRFLHIQSMARGERANPKGVARQMGNMATYRSMSGMMSLSPLQIIQGATINKLASPNGVSKIIKDAINAPENSKKAVSISSNKILKSLVATKLSGR